VDSSYVTHMLHSFRIGNVLGWRLIQEICRLLALNWDIKIYHSYFETNFYGDMFANMGCEHKPIVKIYDQYVLLCSLSC
jgi:hypothetical protein